MSKEINKISQQIKYMLLTRGVTLAQLHKKLCTLNNYKGKSASNLYHKLGRQSIKYSEVLQIAQLLGFEIKLTPKQGWENWE